MIEADIYAAIQSLFAGRVYPDTAPMGVAYPFCVYQQVGGVPSNTFCGNTDKQNARIQFWVWSRTREEANELSRLCEAILTQPTLYGVSQNSLVARYDEATKTYGAQQDISFWYSNVLPSGA
ncbi:MAG: DUF3168 domain-containing protein [Fluviibacter phosphoraccumulans]